MTEKEVTRALDDIAEPRTALDRQAALRAACDALEGLQELVDADDPGWDPTAYYTDPEESRVFLLKMWLRDIKQTKDAAEAAGLVRQAKDEAESAFQAILDAGLDREESDT